MIKSGRSQVNEARQVDNSYTYGKYWIKDTGSGFVAMNGGKQLSGEFVTGREAEKFIDSMGRKQDSDELSQFTRETKLKLIKVNDHTFRDSSGKSYSAIKKLVDQYNKKHYSKVICTNDSVKDITYIKFFG